MKKLVGLFLTPLLLTAPAVAVAKPDSSFGRMFAVVAKSSDKGALAALNQQTNQQLADLAQTMLETSAIPNPKGTTGGITFFGQFIDHDLTLDTAPSPTEAVNVEGLFNARSFPFDLDSVYGGGPKQSPQLYDGDKFKLGTAADRASPDLPRDPNGSAILVEHRNDENLIISQIHLRILRLHNALVDTGMSFDQARQRVIDAYRYVVLNDYLPRSSASGGRPGAGPGPQRRVLQAGVAGPPDDAGGVLRRGIPVRPFPDPERVQHQRLVGWASECSRSTPAVPDLRGGRQLPPNLIMDFDNFFSELPQNDRTKSY